MGPFLEYSFPCNFHPLSLQIQFLANSAPPSGRRPSRHVRILSMGLVGSQTKSVGPCSGIWKRHDTTRPTIFFWYLVSIYLFISHVTSLSMAQPWSMDSNFSNSSLYIRIYWTHFTTSVTASSCSKVCIPILFSLTDVLFHPRRVFSFLLQ